MSAAEFGLPDPALPESAFVDPGGGNRDAVERLARAVLGLVLDHLAGAAGRPPLPPLPGTAPASEPLDLPTAPVPESEILSGLAELLTASMNPGSPGWVGHMDPPPTTFSVLGALAAAAVNNNLLSVEMAPAFSSLEVRLTAAFARLFGLAGASAGGILTSGGTLANLHALAVARNCALGTIDRGVAAAGKEPVILASEHAHTSLAKAAMLLGLGTRAVIAVPADEHLRLRGAALVAALAEARARGQSPFCLVATAGTTVTGTIDTLAEAAEVARAERLWFHVDAAHGGALALSDRERGRLAGIEAADSITFNPQKWMGVAKTSAMALYRDMARLDGSFRVGAPYMRATGGLGNLGEIGVQGTRAAEVLKLWLSLQHLGRSGYARLIERSLGLAERFAEEVRSRAFLELAAPPDTNVLCFRGGVHGRGESAADAWNADLQTALLRAGIFLSLPLWRGRRWLRAVLVNPYAGEEVLRRIFREIDRFQAERGTA